MRKTENSIVDGVIWKQLLLFFLPDFDRHLFFQQLYNTVDTVVVGQYVGKQALAAGRHDRHGHQPAGRLLRRRFLGRYGHCLAVLRRERPREHPRNPSTPRWRLAIVGGVIVMVLGFVSARPVLVAMSVPAEILDDALLYMNVCYAGIIANMIYNVGTGILRAIGDSRMPLYVLIVCCLCERRTRPAVRRRVSLGGVRRSVCHGAFAGDQRGAHHGAPDADTQNPTAWSCARSVLTRVSCAT